jgi:hypothetical protein
MTGHETRGLGLAPATAGDYRELARRRLPRQLFDYLDGAAYDEAHRRARTGAPSSGCGCASASCATSRS